MATTAQLLDQRSTGQVHIRMERDGIAVMKEAGSAKCRMPRGTHEAILINTSGGLAGGDTVDLKAEAGLDARLTLTTQAAERVYRTLGPKASVSISLKAAQGSTVFWMPQETILFEGSGLQRKLDVELADDATFLAVEPMVFGRTERAEWVQWVSVEDRWTVRRAGQLIHAEAFRIEKHWPSSTATFGDNRAMATLLFISPKAGERLEDIRSIVGPNCGASAWNGKLLVRILSKDGFEMRKILKKAIGACVGADNLPKFWTF